MKDALTKSLLLPFVVALFFFGVISWMLYYTNPEDVGLKGVFLLFGMVYFFFFALLEFIFRLRKKHSHNIAVTGVFAAVPTILLGLQSLSQLQFRDILIVFSLAGVVLFYWIQMRGK